MLRSIILVVLATLWTGLLSSFVIVGSPFFTRGEDSIHHIAQTWAKFILFLSGIGVKVSGTENIIPDRSQIFMANHQSFFDIFIVLAFIPTQFRFIAKKELFRVPIFGGALRKYGTIEIDRKHRERAIRSLNIAATKIRTGTSVVTFPEGTRSTDGTIQAFKKGVFYLALSAGAPLIPVSIIGSGKILQKHSLKVHPGNIVMIIGQPVETVDYSESSLDELIARVRNVVVENFDKEKSTL
jgi:1-acyl-sn-glycerol-3-phosphate acyltransferase